MTSKTLALAMVLVTSPIPFSACMTSNTPDNTPVTGYSESKQIPEQYRGVPEDQLPEDVKKEMRGGEPDYPYMEPAIESNQETD